MKPVKSKQEINIIRGKMMCGHADRKDLSDFLYYVSKLESMVEEASLEDFYGTEGWEHYIGWN
jgi:hypothetical protein